MSRNVHTIKVALLVITHATLFTVLVLAGALLGLLGDKTFGLQGFEAGPLPLLGMTAGGVLTLLAACWTLNRTRRAAD